MSNNFSFENSFKAFETLISSIKTDIKKKVFSVLGYSESAISKRLMQRFVELEQYPFKRRFIKNPVQGKGLVFKGELIKLDYIKYDSLNGEISVKASYLGKSIIKFLIQWFYVLLFHIEALLFFTKKYNNKSTIVFGVDIPPLFDYINKDKEFIDFCKNGPIAPLNDASSLIVECKQNYISKQPNYIQYHNNPLRILIRRNGISITDFLFFIALHIKSAFLYFKSIFSFSLMAILDVDFAQHAMIVNLDKRRSIESVITTVSNIFSQPLWMSSLLNKSFRSHMVWYSQNSIFIFTNKTGVFKDADPVFRYIMVDETWVWTKKFSDLLKIKGVCGIFHEVGPITWHLPRQEKARITSNNSLHICIFDITPIHDKMAETIGVARLNGSSLPKEYERFDYLNPETISKFVTDIVSTVKLLESENGRRISVSLKHKREHVEKHDNRYLNLIKDMVNNDEISLIDSRVNLYSLISNIDVAIVVPYTSVAYVADSLNVPSIYFDPNQEIIPIYEETNNIAFASGKDDLKEKLRILFS
jgi:hypothetical protein